MNRHAAGIGGVWSRRDERPSTWRYAAKCSTDLHEHGFEAARNRSEGADRRCGVPPVSNVEPPFGGSVGRAKPQVRGTGR